MMSQSPKHMVEKDGLDDFGTAFDKHCDLETMADYPCSSHPSFKGISTDNSEVFIGNVSIKSTQFTNPIQTYETYSNITPKNVSRESLVRRMST